MEGINELANRTEVIIQNVVHRDKDMGNMKERLRCGRWSEKFTLH